MWSLQLIVMGLCLVAPWVLLIWGGVKVLKRSRRKAQLLEDQVWHECPMTKSE